MVISKTVLLIAEKKLCFRSIKLNVSIKGSHKVSVHPKMVENSPLGAHVFIYLFHLLGNQFSKIMFIFLKSTHIEDFKIRDGICYHRC
jgi:hypothetical protein